MLRFAWLLAGASAVTQTFYVCNDAGDLDFRRAGLSESKRYLLDDTKWYLPGTILLHWACRKPWYALFDRWQLSASAGFGVQNKSFWPALKHSSSSEKSHDC